MSETQPKENEGVFIGKLLFEPNVQIVQSTGKMEAKILVERQEDYKVKGVPAVTTCQFEFYGQPAEWLEKKSLKGGERIRVTYSLGSFEGKDKETNIPNGKHFPKLKGFTVDVSKNEAPPPPKKDDFDF